MMDLSSIDQETQLAIVRRAYAKQLAAFAGDDNPRIEAAFAAIPREAFLGPGPWKTFSGMGAYASTPSADPVYVYCDRLFGLLCAHNINNGQPSLHAALMASAGVQPGEHVLHVGAGTGYYSAILAHIAGPTGRVTAVEFDEGLASRASTNLADVANVRVLHGDGSVIPFDPADVIYVNASVTRIPLPWIDGLRDGGRLFLPMASRGALQRIGTGAFDPTKLARLAASHVIFRIERRKDEFHVGLAVPGAFIPAQGEVTDPDADWALTEALAKGGTKSVTRLYRRDDLPSEQVWLQGVGWCLAYS